MQLTEFVALQKHFRATKALPDALVAKYEILPRSMLLQARAGVPLRIRAFRWVRDLLVLTRLIKPGQRATAWSPKLKHVPVRADANVVIIWAFGHTDKVSLRLGLMAQAESFKSQGGCLRVLLTNMPDFAFYSRLGWLVEFLPALPGDRVAYVQQKLRYLAWRYRDAEVVPWSLK